MISVSVKKGGEVLEDELNGQSKEKHALAMHSYSLIMQKKQMMFRLKFSMRLDYFMKAFEVGRNVSCHLSA